MAIKKISFLRAVWIWLGEVMDLIILWCYAKMFGLMIAMFLSFPKRQRMSHNNGIAAEGWLGIVDDPQFPEHPFFAAGKQYPVRIRHAAATFLDDAMNCIRSISIKFSHHHWHSPFDIEMNTGAQSLFWNAVSFLKFGSMRKEQWGVEYVEYMRRYPDGVDGTHGAVRRDPTSFHNLHYYCKTPFLFVGTDGIRRYAKYRVLPYEDVKETGVEHDFSTWDMPNQRVLPHETRGRNYLKYEFEDRVNRQGARYRLQIQLHTASDDDVPEVFNNMVVWDERTHPWHDLAYFNIEKVLDWKQSTMTTFSVNNMPKTLGVLPAKSIYDYNSLNYMRAHSEIARMARLLSYKVWGMVPPIPDNDNRNVSDWGQ
jgi:arachidonate 5-lipoxygenase